MTTNCLKTIVGTTQKHYMYMKSKLSQIMDNVQQNSGIMIQPEAHKPLREPSLDRDIKLQVGDTLH